uniref:Thioredoxin domain-containing protein n=1 Tax=Kalanchoe fedtschenkoi TaxID=63787 RepID=A0A7N0UKR5_KALFE
MRVWRAAGFGVRIGMTLLALIGGALCEEPSVAGARASEVCPVRSAARSILGGAEQWCDLNGSELDDVVGVIEGDEASLLSAMKMVQNNTHDYVALLFYASWCPFSTRSRPVFSILSALYPTVPHFSVEESSIRPSILSKYGVHGFPTLFLVNSTMRARYRGSQTLRSLVAFYSDVTDMNPVALNITAGLAAGSHSNLKPHGSPEPENCPFSKARSPVNLLQQETYLALATTFVIMRLVYLAFPAISAFARHVRAKYARSSIRLASLWEHPRTCMNGAAHLINSLKDPFKKRNLQALNAKAWASKSLASVSIGDTSSSRRSASVSDR